MVLYNTLRSVSFVRSTVQDILCNVVLVHSYTHSDRHFPPPEQHHVGWSTEKSPIYSHSSGSSELCQGIPTKPRHMLSMCSITRNARVLARTLTLKYKTARSVRGSSFYFVGVRTSLDCRASTICWPKPQYPPEKVARVK